MNTKSRGRLYFDKCLSVQRDIDSVNSSPLNMVRAMSLTTASEKNEERQRQALAALLVIKISNRSDSFSDIDFEHGY